ncbi:MAG: hypothetical protein QOG49_1272, partial [Frankiaceae bacterium]|nr:hypothetical protein [Frankiaceae bacterium]
DDASDSDSASLEEAVLGSAEPAVTTGPWDVDDVEGETFAPRVDLGAIRVPVPKDLELRIEVDDGGTVMAATVGNEHSALQLNAFAAPRRSGLWTEVRTEIAQALTEQGVGSEEADGALGRELRARIPTGDAKGATTSARFVGSDGPRWFLRGLLTGPAATDPVQAEPFEAVFREIVVVRGGEAMAPRDPLTLRLPTEAPARVGQPDAVAYDDLDPFERGPEITEIH